MHIGDITDYLESIADPSLQESYDNSGLIVGEKSWEITGVIISLDCIESIVDEAIEKKCNLIVSHHPIVFEGLKRFNNANYVQRTVQKAIKNDIAIYAIHTNLDNVFNGGVNAEIAKKIGLTNTKILAPKDATVVKLVTYVPEKQMETVREALFNAGAGSLANYQECSFVSAGEGSFKAKPGSQPYVGEIDKRHYEKESKLEVIVNSWQQKQVLNALMKAHPYEEVAYELYPTLNANGSIGSGMIGDLPDELSINAFLEELKTKMELSVIRHTGAKKKIKKVAICGGSGSFLLAHAKRQEADAFVTADYKYHQFFDAEDSLVICDIGHYESEKFTIDLLYDALTEKFSTFAVLKSGVDTNPVKYFH